MSRIAINCRSFLLKKYTGIGRYAHNLVRSLAAIDHENQYFLYARKGLFDLKRSLPRIAAKNFHPRLDLFGRGPKMFGDIDLYHAPSPEALPDIKGKIVVTVHDLIHRVYPQGHTAETIEQTEEHFQQIVARADKIICCSNNTRLDLQKFFTIDNSRVAVIPQGVDKKIFRVLTEQEQRSMKHALKVKGVVEPFLLFIGTIEPRKNLSSLIQSFRLLKTQKIFSGKLVVAGMKGWMQEHLASDIAAQGLEGEIVFLGYLTDEELCGLYNTAEVFVFPSFYEGFGFPILEAFNCGAAVVTSNTSSCAEVAGDAACCVNPADVKDIARGIQRILEDKDLKADLQKKACMRAQDFSFEKTARETFAVYQEVCGDRHES